MPFAVTHILVPVLLLELFRNFYFKDHKKFPRYYVLLAALGGILPDFDIGMYYILYFFGFSIDQVHRTLLHTIFVPLILFLIGIIFYFTGTKIKNLGLRHLKLSTAFFILSFGTLIHLILDAVFSGYIVPLYPILDWRVGLNLLESFPEQMHVLILGTIDGVLLFFWLAWMELKLRITRYF